MRLLRSLVLGVLISGSLSIASPSSAASATSSLRSIAAYRVFDSATNGRVSANVPLVLTVTGRGSIPSGALAVVVNVIASSPSGPGGLFFHPNGSVRPLQTLMALPASGGSRIQTLTLPVATNGKIDIVSTAAVNLTVDVVGVFLPMTSSRSGRFQSGVESLALDRTAKPLAINEAVDIRVPASVPRDAEAVLLTVAVSGATRNGSWWLTSQGVTSPIVSGRVGESAVNTVIARPTNGVLRLATDSGGFVSATVVGWFTGGSAASGSDGLYVAQAPLRLVDTTGPLDPLGAGVALHTGWTMEVKVLGQAGVPTTGVGAVAIVVGTSNAHGPGGTVAYAAGQARPNVVHIDADRSGAFGSTAVAVAVGDRGLSIFSESGTDVTIDVVGWFTGSAKKALVGTPINVTPRPDSFPGVLWVPDLNLYTKVREDIRWVDYDPGHLPESRSPNQPGNVAIFGHRTSHGKEFRNLDRMKIGSPIVLVVAQKTYTYSTTAVEVLSPEDPLIYGTTNNEQTISLVACHPPGSVKFRIVVRGKLISVGPG